MRFMSLTVGGYLASNSISLLASRDTHKKKTHMQSIALISSYAIRSIIFILFPSPCFIVIYLLFNYSMKNTIYLFDFFCCSRNCLRLSYVSLTHSVCWLYAQTRIVSLTFTMTFSSNHRNSIISSRKLAHRKADKFLDRMTKFWSK